MAIKVEGSFVLAKLSLMSGKSIPLYGDCGLDFWLLK